MNLNTPISLSIGDPYMDRPPVAIYVHGLASGANATTFKRLAKRFPQFVWLTADFGEELAKNVQYLNEMIRYNYPQLIVGTSLGGLTVLYADAPEAVKVACNPALTIADCVRHTIGLGRHPYFCERLDGATEFELTEQICRDYERYIATHTPSLGRASYAIFSAHDELLGDQAAVAAQRLLADSGYRIFVDPEGKHQIQTSTIDLIDKEVVAHGCFEGISPRNGEQSSEKGIAKNR